MSLSMWTRASTPPSVRFASPSRTIPPSHAIWKPWWVKATGSLGTWRSLGRRAPCRNECVNQMCGSQLWPTQAGLSAAQARADAHLWASSYEGEVKDVLEMQDAVARDVVEQIRLRLTADEKTFSAPEFRRGYVYSAFRWRLLQRSFPSTRNMEKEAKSPGPKPAKAR